MRRIDLPILQHHLILCPKLKSLELLLSLLFFINLIILISHKFLSETLSEIILLIVRYPLENPYRIFSLSSVDSLEASLLRSSHR